MKKALDATKKKLSRIKTPKLTLPKKRKQEPSSDKSQQTDSPRKGRFKRDFALKASLARFSKFKVDRKHLDRVMNLKVEKLPTLSQCFRQALKLKLVFFFVIGLMLADLLLKGSAVFLLGGEEAPRRSNVRQDPASKQFTKAKDSYEELISSNIFCRGCPVPDLKAIATSRPKDCGKAKPLRGGIELVGTIVLSNAKFSVATIADGTQTHALKRGESFQRYGTVFEIRRDRVCFEGPDGLLSFLALPDVEEFATAESTAAIENASSGNKRISKGIVQTGEHDLTLDKSFVLEQTNNPSILYEAYATEYRVDGEVQGFRIHSINPGSVIEQLGFQPGDIIVEVDGKSMDSVARAQELYASVATTTDMAITILRDGNRITKSYTVK